MAPTAQPDNAILRAAISVVADLCAQLGNALATPITARWRTSQHGSTGIELTVKLTDPSRARATSAAIAERFGGMGGVDFVHVS